MRQKSVFQSTIVKNKTKREGKNKKQTTKRKKAGPKKRAAISQKDKTNKQIEINK
jgi:hypothetical protein